MRRFARHAFVPLAAILLCHPALGTPWEIAYSAQLTKADGSVMSAGDIVGKGVKFAFYSVASGGTAIPVSLLSAAWDATTPPPPLPVANTFLSDCTGLTGCTSFTLSPGGVFQISLFLSPADFNAVFSSPTVYIEMTVGTVTGIVFVPDGPAYPRQRFTAAPYCLRVPVDGSTVTFDANGKLTVANASITDQQMGAITTPGKVSGGAITSGTIGGSTTINTSGTITAASGVFAGTLTVAGSPVTTGTGTSGYLPRWTSAGSLGSSALFQLGSNIGVGTASPGATLEVNGTTKLSGTLTVADGTHGENKVLTSNAAGAATWKTGPFAQLCPSGEYLSGFDENGYKICHSISAYLTSQNRFVDIQGGHAWNCALMADTSVRCWGYNGWQNLGTNSTGDQSTPENVRKADGTKLMNVTQVAAGSYHACAIAAGELYCWGYNGNGMCGNIIGGNVPLARKVTGLGTVIHVSTGGYHTCVAESGGTVKCWGYNGHGPIGPINVGGNVEAPTAITGVSNVTQVAAGELFSCALQQDKNVYCWGYNGSGALGDGTGASSYTPVRALISNVTQISAGAYGTVQGYGHICALTTDKRVSCWGWGGWGNLGNNSTANQLSPVVVKDFDRPSGGDYLELENVKHISAGAFGTCAALFDGTARCWGYNGHGQLGDGTGNYSGVAKPVCAMGTAAGCTTYLSGVSRISLSNTNSGPSHTMAVFSDGTAAGWGYSAHNQALDRSYSHGIVIPAGAQYP